MNNSQLEKNIRAIDHFIYVINKYEFRGGKYGEGLFLDKYVDQIRLYKKDTNTVFSENLDKLYVDIHELKGYCIRYIEIYKLRESEYNGLLNELLLDLYSIPSYNYEYVYAFIGKMVTKTKNIEQGMFQS